MSVHEMEHGGRFHMDDRGIRYCDIFPEIEKGDINVSIIEPGAAALWHRHKKQDDYQIVIKGSLKVGVCNAPYSDTDDLISYGLTESDIIYMSENRAPLIAEWKQLRIDGIKEQPLLERWPADESIAEWYYLSEKNANHGPLFIPRHLWHGCYNCTNAPAILIYHITNKYDGEDEERLHPLVAGWHYERQVK